MVNRNPNNHFFFLSSTIDETGLGFLQSETRWQGLCQQKIYCQIKIQRTPHPSKEILQNIWKETTSPCSFVLAETIEILLLDIAAHSKHWCFSRLQHITRNFKIFNRGSINLDPTHLTYLHFQWWKRVKTNKPPL